MWNWRFAQLWRNSNFLYLIPKILGVTHTFVSHLFLGFFDFHYFIDHYYTPLRQVNTILIHNMLHKITWHMIWLDMTLHEIHKLTRYQTCQVIRDTTCGILCNMTCTMTYDMSNDMQSKISPIVMVVKSRCSPVQDRW